MEIYGGGGVSVGFTSAPAAANSLAIGVSGDVNVEDGTLHVGASGGVLPDGLLIIDSVGSIDLQGGEARARYIDNRGTIRGAGTLYGTNPTAHTVFNKGLLDPSAVGLLPGGAIGVNGRFLQTATGHLAIGLPPACQRRHLIGRHTGGEPKRLLNWRALPY
jgi:hypothetical protein